MQLQGISSYVWLFFIYSFLGWVLECAYAAVRRRHFVNRGVLSAPLCCIYGVAAVAITALLDDLTGSWLFLFLGAAIIGGAVEWLSGRLLQKLFRRRWWDYSEKKRHIDGYVSLESTVLWGVLGVIVVCFLNPLFIGFLNSLSSSLLTIVAWVMLGLLLVDIGGTYYALWGKDISATQTNLTGRLRRISHKINAWMIQTVQNRIERAHPTAKEKAEKEKASKIFAYGCGFYKLFWLFFIGAFLGDLTETVFCRVTGGEWMSRSSVVWGPFSIVWGLALALGTLLLYNYRDRSDAFIFGFGTFLGGAYEYVCSVFTELAFGQVFWDYSEIPFNLGGRINLLYCFFWGIASVLWLKKLYPVLSKWIEKVPLKAGKIITWCAFIFMVCNIAVSGLALARHTARAAGQPATAAWEQWIDSNYGDAVIERVYPNLIFVE